TFLKRKRPAPESSPVRPPAYHDEYTQTPGVYRTESMESSRAAGSAFRQFESARRRSKEPIEKIATLSQYALRIGAARLGIAALEMRRRFACLTNTSLKTRSAATLNYCLRT